MMPVSVYSLYRPLLMEQTINEQKFSFLNYNYTMRFIGYDSIQTRQFMSYPVIAFKFAQKRSINTKESGR